MESPINRFMLMTPTGRKGRVGVHRSKTYPLQSGFFVPPSMLVFLLLKGLSVQPVQ